MSDLAELVAEMRALGVLEYEREGVRVKLGPAPLPPSDARVELSSDERRDQEQRTLLGKLLGATSTRPRI